MQPGLFATHDSRTLLVDVNNELGGLLVEQINHAGFKTDFAVSWGAAHAALRANSYQSCVVVADLNQSAVLEQLEELRREALRVWIIVLSDLQPDDALVLAHRRGIDAVMSTPFSMNDLAARLAAFSVRARPAF